MPKSYMNYSLFQYQTRRNKLHKTKLFIENFFIYGFGGSISKIIPLIMLPIVTRVMPSSLYFGLNDMSTLIVNFCSYFAIMGMYDAMYRMFFENEEKEYKRSVCSTTLFFYIVYINDTIPVHAHFQMVYCFFFL